MNTIDDLQKIVPPPKKPKNAGSLRGWERIKSCADLPDWLFHLFHAYGSGQFSIYEKPKNGTRTWQMDSIELLNVFDQPLLERHRRIGSGFAEVSKDQHLAVDFFPQSTRGLFPITTSDQNLYLLIDPKNDRKVYLTHKFLSPLKEVNQSFFDFMCLAFVGAKDFGYIACGTQSPPAISNVIFHQNWRDAYE